MKSAINNKGFTLTEVLAAVVIIGILSTVAIVTVSNVTKKSHDEYDEKQNKLFTVAAQTYFTDNRSELPSKLLTENEVTLRKLIEENYIDEIVDYKKKPYKQDESKAYVKKTGRGRYVYSSTLIGSDGREISPPENPKKSGDINVTINHNTYGLTSMERAIDDVYYINKEIEIVVSGNSTSGDGISSWQYKIERAPNVNSSDWKKYKSSSEVAVDGTSFSDTITINAKDFANGVYRLVVYAYGYNNEQNEKYSKTIVIDKTKPKCTIKMNSDPDGEPVDTNVIKIKDGKTYNWYKAGNQLSAKMTITEKNKYKYTIGLEETNEINEDNSNKEETFIINHNIVGGYVYGYVKDKAGNEGKCKTNDQIYYDKTLPTCDIETSGEYHSSTGWYWSNVELDLKYYDDNGKKESVKGDNESGIKEKYGLTESGTFGLPKKVPPEYTKVYTQSQLETKGTIWYGYVEDEAGNQGECKTGEIKVDTNDPICAVTLSGTESKLNGVLTGWYTTNVTATGNCSDTTNGSGCINNTSVSINYNTAGENLTPADVYDNAGRSGQCETKTIKIDKTPPTWINNCNGYDACQGNGITSRYNNIWFNKEDYENSGSNGYRMGQYYDPSVSGIYSIERYVDNVEKPAAVYPGTGETYTPNYRQTNFYSNEQNSQVCYKLVNNAGLKSNLSCVQVKIDRTIPTLSIDFDGNHTIKATCTDNEGGSGVDYVWTGLIDSETYKTTKISDTEWHHFYTTSGDKNTPFNCKDNAGNKGVMQSTHIRCACYSGSTVKRDWNADPEWKCDNHSDTATSPPYSISCWVVT